MFKNLFSNRFILYFCIFPQLKVYTTVIDDVIAGVRDAFLDEGVDEQVLQEMKQVWTSKLLACKAIESTPESQDQQAGGNAKVRFMVKFFPTREVYCVRICK